MAGRLSVNVERWLEGKTVEDFQAIEHGPHLLFPDVITRRNAKGEAVDVPVLLRVPGADDILAGRFDAIAHVNRMLAKHGKVKGEVRTLAEAREAVGIDHFENTETQAIVARCLHETKPPHQLAYTLEMLRAEFLPPAISAVFKRMSILNLMLDPNLDELTEEQFWAVTLAIAEKRSISPLGVMPGNTEAGYLVRLCTELLVAKAALAQPTPNSSSISTETSTPAS